MLYTDVWYRAEGGFRRKGLLLSSLHYKGCIPRGASIYVVVGSFALSVFCFVHIRLELVQGSCTPFVVYILNLFEDEFLYLVSS